MNTSSLSLFIVAVPPIVGSFIVLALAAVGWSVWITHLVAIIVACCLGLMGSHMHKRGNHLSVTCVVVILTLIGLAPYQDYLHLQGDALQYCQLYRQQGRHLDSAKRDSAVMAYLSLPKGVVLTAPPLSSSQLSEPKG